MIGADPTINPELILQGLSTTDPGYIEQSALAGQEAGAKVAEVPAEMRLKESQAWMLSADAYWKNWIDNLLPAAKGVDQKVIQKLKATYNPQGQGGSETAPSTNAPGGATAYGYDQNKSPSPSSQVTSSMPTGASNG